MITSLEPIFTALGIEAPGYVSILDAGRMREMHVPPFPPDAPALVVDLAAGELAARVAAVLGAAYPPEHPLKLVPASGMADGPVEALTLQDLAACRWGDAPQILYIPPLGSAASFEAFQEVVAHLRAPNGCPWDREQTHQSLRPYLLEETYETLTALDAEDNGAMREEFGDLLLQIVLHAQIAGEAGEFRMADVLQTIHDKLVRRHPHVFGDVQVDGVGRVLQNWEKLKAEERKEKGQEGAGLLDSIPLALPALVQAQEYQKRAARVGFDWPDVEGILAKICEEAEEVRSAETPEGRAAEVGDLIFAVVNLARWYHVDSESTLRETNLRFRRRFAHIERAARAQGRAISEMSLQEMDDLWEAAKQAE
jgi:tetrapyrrole methylase family protein/MazG family protein